MSWTDERINTLKKMWQSGKSASEIAEKLGGVTRNAVIGKAHRLGLSGRPSPIKKIVKKSVAAAPVKKAAPAAPAKPVASAKSATPVGKAAAPVGKIATIAPKIPANAPGKPAEIVPLAALANMTSRKDGKLVSILELSEKICRWPVGDRKEGAFGYCGSESHPGHPYCAEHVAIAFQAPNRKDKKPVAKGLKVEPELEDLEVEVEEVEGEEEDEALVESDDEDDDDTAVLV